MPCPYRAVLLVTRDMRGTNSSIAKERTELTCVEPEGHEGPHHDARTGIRWDDGGKAVKTFLRHEDEPFKDRYP